MSRSRQFAVRLANLVEAAGRLSSLCFLAIIAVIVFDVVSRRLFDLGLSTKMQELEWHLHTLLFCFCLGFGYIRDTHVRVDLVRERLGPRTRAVIELVGITVLLMPFLATMIYYSIDFAHTAYLQGEVSSAGTGLAYRWIVKSFIPIGLSILFVAGLSKAILHAHQLIAGVYQHPDPQSPAISPTDPERADA